MPDDMLQRNILEQLKGVREDIRDLRGDMDDKWNQMDATYVRKDVYSVDGANNDRRLTKLESALSVPRILSYCSMATTIILVVIALHNAHILF